MTIWVLLTAMPPTEGHKELIQFAARYAHFNDSIAKIVLNTQPSEPMVAQRAAAIREIAKHVIADVVHINKEIEQDAEAPGFWDMWRELLTSRGALPGDTYIASEVYGKRLAEEMGGKFMPYDPNREMYKVKATNVRKQLIQYWPSIAPEFAEYLSLSVTIFGAESTGKSTLTRRLKSLRSRTTLEYARPYLEQTVNEITTETMTDIWKGQVALQSATNWWNPVPFRIQDTDLFSTVGYWEFPHWQSTLGPVPDELYSDARYYKSDLYIITPSNIPFEEDPLRYGGTVREGSDEYWIALCEREGLNYKVLTGQTLEERAQEANELMVNLFQEKTASLREYERKNN